MSKDKKFIGWSEAFALSARHRQLFLSLGAIEGLSRRFACVLAPSWKFCKRTSISSQSHKLCYRESVIRRASRGKMSYLLPHLHSGWAVDQAILAEEERVVVIRFGHDWDETCMLCVNLFILLVLTTIFLCIN